MRMSVIALLGFGALALGLVFGISPNRATTANEASMVPGIDISVLTKKATALPEKSLPGCAFYTFHGAPKENNAAVTLD